MALNTEFTQGMTLLALKNTKLEQIGPVLPRAN
jgi:hypothetical protein